MISNERKYVDATEYCSKITDGTHDSPKRVQNGRKLITSKHIKGRNIDFDNAYNIALTDYEKIILRSKVDQWDVIISMIGEYCGFCYVEQNETIDYAIKNVGLYKTGNRNKAFWLYYYLNSPEGRQSLLALKSGTSQPYISLGALRSLQVLVPSNENELAKIVEILSTIDDKIDLLQRQNKTLEQLAQTLFRQWFIEEAQGDFVELGTILKTTSGGTPSRNKMEYYDGGKYNWVKSKELGGSFIFDTEEKITEDALNNSSAKVLPKNSILVAMYGATVGQYAILGSESTCNQAICAIIPNDKYPYTFIFSFIKANKDEIINMAVGSAQQNISQILIQKLLIPSPSNKIFEFHKYSEQLFEKIKSNMKQIHTLETLRDTLLPKLISGEIRVKF